MSETWQLQVKGKVQGVWFRASTRQTAIELGLIGWVKNNPDGSVTVLAHGEPDQLRALEQWCRSGPPLARVTAVEREVQAVDPILSGFEIMQ